MKRHLVLAVLGVALLVLAAGLSCGAQQGGDLTGTVWALSELNGESLVAGSSITAAFTPAGEVAGSAGCNRYSGPYTVSANEITFSSMATTRMMCEQAVMDQETAYLQALADSRAYRVSGDQLTLTGANNTTLAVYKAQSQDLAGTSWDAISYNNGRQAVVSALSGTTLTAEFGKDGRISGNGGCNTYSGEYKVTEDQITLGSLVSTTMACVDPAGVMDQEAQYLAALQSAATYLIEGDVLELRTADGSLAAQFNRK